MAGRFVYPVTLADDGEGGLVATVPDLPEVVTGGADRSKALVEAADALEEGLAGRIVDREPIPAPSPARGRPVVAPGALIAAKAALYLATREADISNVALARRLGCQESEVRRMLDPRHATKIPRIETALAALGKRLIVEVHDAA